MNDGAPCSDTALTFLPVYQPDLSGNERRYLLEAFDSTWISSRGKFLDRFEAAFASVVGTPHVTAVCNGTVALHLALHALGLRPGDEVIVPSFTYIASVNTIVQAGGVPVFAEVAADDWLLDPEVISARITPRTRAVMPVHLYGAVCDMDRISAMARDRGLAVVEDCAEALGSSWRGRHVGSWSDVATFSFFGNKTVTTGEGGMVLARDAEILRRLQIAKGQGMDPERRYWHVAMGFNYRMTNLAAAIGLGQIERLEDILARKRAIAARYRDNLAGHPFTFQARKPEVTNSEWLISLLLPPRCDRDAVMRRLAAARIETRPVFYCAHHMPHHARPDVSLPVSEDIAARGISLPSYPSLSMAEVDRVCEALVEAVRAS
ncbi:DegT/DnrJ/EryC1/StrS family aminotransferase [Falsiroseomonas oryziterrae]|uniref:DegT/DnrJ/EryC1/StrS family aminotransferase n=1 Tax=Falsiroseomonas oryziterrae TaxID=2911368 RepID=UPI001F3C7A29|nr:DegT/DnrJ/EryC1/StrS family aminotransferase [Roseomonas sp. NPKOSM-4]